MIWVSIIVSIIIAIIQFLVNRKTLSKRQRANLSTFFGHVRNAETLAGNKFGIEAAPISYAETMRQAERAKKVRVPKEEEEE